MLLVFWVLWRLRGLNARETFAAVRLPIPGAVPTSAAVMAFYLRSFGADKLNTKTAAERRLQTTARYWPDASKRSLLQVRSVTGSPRLGLKPVAAQADALQQRYEHAVQHPYRSTGF